MSKVDEANHYQVQSCQGVKDEKQNDSGIKDDLVYEEKDEKHNVCDMCQSLDHILVKALPRLWQQANNLAYGDNPHDP